MAKRAKEWFYLIERTVLDEETVGLVLDMLRYDSARVECNPPPGYYLLRTTAASGPRIERWQSFGITVAWVGTDHMKAFDWARTRPKKVTV